MICSELPRRHALASRLHGKLGHARSASTGSEESVLLCRTLLDDAVGRTCIRADSHRDVGSESID